MSVKTDIQAELTKLGIAFDEDATTAELRALLPKGDVVANEPDDETNADGFVVNDPLVYKPQDLPLVVTLPAGKEWANPEQAEYAKILNAAAYCFPDNWNKLQTDPQTGADIPNSAPKHVELKRLAEIGKNPSKFYVYTGTDPLSQGVLKIKNTLIEK